MKTIISHLISISMLSGLLFCCSEKDEVSPPPEIISWINSCNFRNEISGPWGLSKKSDNGFLVAGYIAYYDTNLRHGYVMNLDSNGDTIWCKQIDIENYYSCDVYSAIQISQDETMAAGCCRNYDNESVRFITWLNADGQIIKNVMLPVLSGYNVWECKLFLLGNGNMYYVSCLGKIDPENDLSDASLRVDLLNSEGQIIRSNDYLNVNTTMDKVRMLDDGKLLVTGGTSPGANAGDTEILFLLVDETGNELHRQAFGTDSWDMGYAVCTDYDNGYLVAGTLALTSESAIYPVNASGEVGNYTAVADTIYSHRTYLEKASDGQYVSFILSSERLYVIKLGSNFQAKWTTWLDHSGCYACLTLSDIVRMEDGSFALLYENDNGNVIIKTIPL